MYINLILVSTISVLFFCSCAKSIEPQQAQLHVIIKMLEESESEERVDLDEKVEHLVPESNKTYGEMKIFVRNKIAQADSNAIGQDSLSALFTHLLVDSIIPYWYGTEWSFEGHTSRPNKGSIACGYFVSTTLQDVGLNINKYRLAQQSPLNEARSLCFDEKILLVDEPSLKSTIAVIHEKLENGIYFLGFNESHVGFVLKRGGKLFVVHSNYIGYDGVVMEPIKESMAFSYCQRFYIVPLSTNKELLKRWLKYEEVVVVNKRTKVSLSNTVQ